ncbi:hypothetical protein Hanom_Chr01g00017461 [Helianthus anomalus]
MLQIYLNNCGYLAFMSLSSSQVNSAPRLPSHRTFTIGMRERLSCLVSHPNRWRKHRGMALSETDCSEVSITTINIIQFK